MRTTLFHRKTAIWVFAACLLGGACLVSGWAAAKPATITSIRGTCTFGNKTNDWSAKLTAKGNGTYDAVYVSSWSGKPLSYVGTIKTDLKTEISGTGKAIEGKGNGTFEFSGKFGVDGIAQCRYKEIGSRGRNGSLTAEMPRSDP